MNQKTLFFDSRRCCASAPRTVLVVLFLLSKYFRSCNRISSIQASRL